MAGQAFFVSSLWPARQTAFLPFLATFPALIVIGSSRMAWLVSPAAVEAELLVWRQQNASTCCGTCCGQYRQLLCKASTIAAASRHSDCKRSNTSQNGCRRADRATIRIGWRPNSFAFPIPVPFRQKRSFVCGSFSSVARLLCWPRASVFRWLKPSAVAAPVLLNRWLTPLGIPRFGVWAVVVADSAPPILPLILTPSCRRRV